MPSLWKKNIQIAEQDSLQGNVHVQNVVIGAGITGILTAYFLQKKGKQVIVLEASEIASGQTQNTTAKITSQHGFFYHDMAHKVGKDRARGYARANEAAIQSYEEIIWEEGIACHFERLPSYLYTTNKAKIKKLEDEANTAKKLGIHANFVNGEEIGELPFPVAGAVCYREQAQFHPLEFIQALAKKLTIYEHTSALSVKQHEIVYENRKPQKNTLGENTIIAENIIFTTHYPFLNVPGFYFLRQHQERSYVLALEGEGIPARLSGQYFSMDKDGLSFRSAENMLLLGGGSHRTGKDICKNGDDKPEGYTYLQQVAKRYYPHSREVVHWSAQDCMSHDRLPFIGSYSMFRPYWYVATGFQKWGMTSAMIAASIISNRICNEQNPYEWVFTPQRFLVRAGVKNLCVDIGKSVIGLTKGVFAESEKRCSHMGCKLVWNEAEQSWDCPCHGSRFTKEGNLLDGPAQRGLKKEDL